MPDKKYNRPAQITDAVRREEMEKRRRDIAERENEDNIPASDKARMKRMIDGDYDADYPSSDRMSDVESYRDEAYAKGGMVKKKKYAMGGSVRGGGIAIKGVGKGKVC